MSRARAGFTLTEVAIAITVALLVAALAIPRLGNAMSRVRIAQASQVVAADLDLALALAAQQRHPVRLVYSSARGEYALSDLVSGRVLRRRAIGTHSEWRVDTVRFQPDSVDVSPVGLASSPISIFLRGTGVRRKITMSRTGLVRVTPQ